MTDGNGGTASDSFVLTVPPVNDLPTISDITDKTTDQNTASGPLAFTVGDVETAAAAVDGLRDVVQHDAGARREHRLRRHGREPHRDRHAGAQSDRHGDDHDHGDGRHRRDRERQLRADGHGPENPGAGGGVWIRRGQRDDRRRRSGGSNTGTITGATWSAAGRFGQALSFDGDDWVTVAHAASLGLTTGMTLEAWVRPVTNEPADWRTVMLKERPGGLAYALYADTSTRLPEGSINTGGNDASAVGTPRLPLNTWTHVATTYDGAQLRIYINGVQVRHPGDHRRASSRRRASLRFGGNAVWGEYFVGLLDEIRIYDGPRLPAEIQADMDTAVQGLNAAPTISDVTDQTTVEDTATAALGLTVGDVETPAGVADAHGQLVEHDAGAGGQHRVRRQRMRAGR